MLDMKKLNSLLTKVETGFNVVGSLPVAGMFSGTIRAVLGKVQIIAGAAFAAAGFVGSYMDKKNAEKWNVCMQQGSDHVIHGALNFFRGVGEAFLSATLIGSLIPLAFNLTSSEGFGPVYKYEEAHSTRLNTMMPVVS